MALDAATVESFTHGRLDSDDPETVRQLAAAVGAARRYCGWHVTPVVTNQSVTMDGPGNRILALPTLQLGSVTSIREDGITLNLADLQVSARGVVLKTDGTFWTDKLGGIVAVFTHGYSAAPDFESAVFSSIERGAFSADTAPRVIGPFQYAQSLEDRLQFSDAERAVLDFYKLEKQP
jgi:hypothetical protein